MSLFFDAEWFDAKLAARRLDRTALAVALGIEPAELHRVFTNERAPTAEDLTIFANVLGADLVEVTLRSGVASRPADDRSEDSADRIASIEARLDAIDSWLAEFESGKKSA
ncbi:MAG TPA: helix-turn-helix transcriptional regulator [Vitreimonas sp.]|uniref:helix-turn-helix domain-containing protein n=1 Tax=Vitreimonas sp. TaxID=3069702 RepID=UPI002D30248B|nr:helix-turn-helix transcriptional regulator [Vitreimonas sp.]HYD86997.1 helix-turn-helix transcriptional regulator [Vitreimonas sp.]